MLRQKVLTQWKSCQSKLTKLIYLSQKKQLIKDALEIHLHESSRFLSTLVLETQAQRAGINHPDLLNWDELKPIPLTEPTTPERDPRTGIINEEWKEYHQKKSWNSCLLQKQKNEQIVKECQELLTQLNN